MDLTDRQRKLLFAALVVLLAAAGVFLTVGSGSGKHKSTAQRRADASTSPSAVPSTTAPGATGPPPSPGSYDIYSMLPFSQKEFTTAADVARRFTIAYGTYRYDEDPKTYLGRLQGLVTAELTPQLQPTPAMLQQRQQDQEVSTSDAQLDSLRFFSKDQLIFVVTGKQHITKGGSTSETSEQYAVTMTRSGGGWVVYAFRPADEGDN